LLTPYIWLRRMNASRLLIELVVRIRLHVFFIRGLLFVVRAISIVWADIPQMICKLALASACWMVTPVFPSDHIGRFHRRASQCRSLMIGFALSK
jgi:hypothetical protein